MVSFVRLGDGVLLVDALAHVGTRRLPYLYPARERRVVVHVYLRHRTPHGGEYLFCRLHGFYVGFMILRRSFGDVGLFHRSYHALDKGNLILRQAVFLIQHLVCPWVGEVLKGDESKHTSRYLHGAFPKIQKNLEEVGFHI